MKKRITIDLVPIRVGEGGTGSGIWTYARELIRHMDQVELDGLDVVCLVNAGQLPYLSGLSRIRLVEFPTFGKNIVLRLLWIHLFLPLVCLFRRVDVLHKLATETPFFCPAKRVTTVHDFYYEFLMENHPPETIRLYERLENLYFSLTTRTCFKKSRAIIAVSDATRQEAIKRYPKSADRIRVIHHGVFSGRARPPGGPELESSLAAKSRKESQNKGMPVSAHQSTKNQAASVATDNLRQQIKTEGIDSLRTDIESSAFNILCVAKFMEHKGQHVLIDAFEALLEQNADLVGSMRLELRGFHNDADYCSRITQRISSSRYAEYMRMVGFDPRGGLEAIYHDADLVVLLSSYEGFGFPVLEAQGMGIPVLCSDLPVLREVGGKGAVYVDRDDAQAVAERLTRFVSDQEFCQEMKTLGTENTKRFRWERAAQETIRCYEEVLY